ncbi:MAG: cytochrome c peroxidase [Planctomycetota bacterium]|nr:cytochrome c peroxidase [Planctomycetota bacterium]
MQNLVRTTAILSSGLALSFLASCSSSSGSNTTAADQQQALIELGHKLMFDEDLSRPAGVSCGMCHDPQRGWGDDRPQGKGVQDHTLNTATGAIPHDTTLAVSGNRFKTILTDRNTPTIYNSHLFPNNFWDGRAGDLMHQANFPVDGFNEMNAGWDDHVIPVLEADADYPDMFAAAFGDSTITQERTVTAIGAYEETISVFDTPYDQYVAGDTSALTAAQVNGMDLFFGAAGCATCHPAPMLTDLSFHNLGVPDVGQVVMAGGTDIGRGAGDDFTPLPINPATSSPDPDQDYKFKTPQLRMVKVTGPYFHNGAFADLRDAIEFIAEGGGTDLSTNGTKAPEIVDLGLTSGQLDDLVDFVQNGLMGTEIK